MYITQLSFPERPRFRIADIEPVYKYPQVTVDTGTRTTVHRPVDAEPVVQRLGTTLPTISVKGTCYIDTANALDGLVEQTEVEIRSHRWSGRAILNTVSTKPAGQKGGKRDDWQYTYTLELTGV